MFKKLREKIYNRNIEKELKEIESFQIFTNELYSIYPTFVGLNKKEQIVSFVPKTVYALKRAIQKLSTEYITNTTTTHFEKLLERAFQNAGFDKSRIRECMTLFNNKKTLLEKSKKFGFDDGRLNKVEEFLKFYGFNWDGRYSSVHCPNPKMAESFDDLNPEYECAFLYETNGKGGFFLISKVMFSRFKHTHGDNFEEIANYEKEWKEFIAEKKIESRN